MSVLERRKKGGGGGPASPPAKAAAQAAQPSPQAKERSRRSRDEEYYTTDSEHGVRSATDSEDEERSRRGSSRARAIRRAERMEGRSRMGLGAALNLLQMLVFATLMMQGLNLFVSYHSLLATQHDHSALTAHAAGLSSVSAGLAQLGGGVAELASSLGELRADVAPLSRKLDLLSELLKRRLSTAKDSSEASEEEDEEWLEEWAAVDAESAKREAEKKVKAKKAAAEKEAVEKKAAQKEAAKKEEQAAPKEEQHASKPTPPGTGATAPTPVPWRPPPNIRRMRRGGNRLMELRPGDAARLHLFRNWTDDSSGSAYDAGASHNQTRSIMTLLGQLDEAGEQWKDVRVVELRRDDRTTVAARPIQAGEYFFRIPEKYLLTSLVVGASPLGQQLYVSGFDGDEMVWMSVYVLYERFNADSPWKFWLNILPRSYRHMPQTFDWEGELELIEGTQTLEWVLDYQQSFRREYVALAHHLQSMDFSQFSFAQYCWARLAVATRAFGASIPRRDENDSSKPAPPGPNGEVEYQHITLMAALDLINHEGEHRKIDAVWNWNEPTKEFSFKAVRDIREGAVIHTTYGQRGNSDLLVHYGFTLAHNPYDFSAMCVGVDPQAPSFQQRQSILASSFLMMDDGCPILSQNNLPPGFRCRVMLDLLSGATQECFQFARVASAAEEHFEQRYNQPYLQELAERERLVKAGAVDENMEFRPELDGLYAVDFDAEVRVTRYLADWAKKGLTLIPGGSADDDRSLLRAHSEAQKEGRCDDAENESLWWKPPRSGSGSVNGTGGPCLRLNHLNLLRVRSGEKHVLEQLVRLGDLAEQFARDAPGSVEAAFNWLQRLTYTEEQLAAFAAEDITPLYHVLLFFNEHLIPLYVQQRGWEQTLPPHVQPDSEQDRRPATLLRHKWRKMYVTDTPEQAEHNDRMFGEFHYEK